MSLSKRLLLSCYAVCHYLVKASNDSSLVLRHSCLLFRSATLCSPSASATMARCLPASTTATSSRWCGSEGLGPNMPSLTSSPRSVPTSDSTTPPLYVTARADAYQFWPVDGSAVRRSGGKSVWTIVTNYKSVVSCTFSFTVCITANMGTTDTQLEKVWKFCNQS